jgi:PAS domain S-box-containing protein
MTPVEALLPEDIRERHIAHRTKYFSDLRTRPMGTGLDLAARRADGTTFPVDIMLSPLAHLAESIVLAVVRDVTDRRTTEKVQLAFEVAQLGWWSYDLLSGTITGDTRFKEIFDVAGDEVPIKDPKKLVHPDDAERFSADREASLDPTNPPRSPQEYRVLRRDGEVRWVEVRRHAHIEGAGRERRATSVMGVAQDITERKRNEEQIQLLMREASHRAKNMLSVIDAIARQTATRNAEDFVERFSERVQALAATQDLLTRSEWQGIEADDPVRAQLRPFTDLIGSRIVIRDATLRLNAASAQAIGLALHELATNAAKYGSLSTDTGRVDVTWRIVGDTFTMSWTEREGPPVSAPQQRGFGTIVMQSMAGRSVGGTVDLDCAPSGLTWRLTCPAANVLERT